MVNYLYTDKSQNYLEQSLIDMKIFIIKTLLIGILLGLMSEVFLPMVNVADGFVNILGVLFLFFSSIGIYYVIKITDITLGKKEKKWTPDPNKGEGTSTYHGLSGKNGPSN